MRAYTLTVERTIQFETENDDHAEAEAKAATAAVDAALGEHVPGELIEFAHDVRRGERGKVLWHDGTGADHA